MITTQRMMYSVHFGNNFVSYCDEDMLFVDGQPRTGWHKGFHVFNIRNLETFEHEFHPELWINFSAIQQINPLGLRTVESIMD